MGKRELKLGELELEVLKAIWELQPCTVQQVAEALAEARGSARTTVLTVMQRLHAKGMLARRKRSGVYRYVTKHRKGEVLSGLVGQFVDRVLDGSPGPFVAYLAEADDLTDEQVATLRAIVRRLEDGSEEDDR